jgi:hypothetical protein
LAWAAERSRKKRKISLVCLSFLPLSALPFPLFLSRGKSPKRICGVFFGGSSDAADADAGFVCTADAGVTWLAREAVARPPPLRPFFGPSAAQPQSSLLLKEKC